MNLIARRDGQPDFIQAEAGSLLALWSNYASYADLSDRVITTIGHRSPVQEIYSIDESFLDLTGFRCALTDYGMAI
jgi:DNA polymerase V